MVLMGEPQKKLQTDTAVPLLEVFYFFLGSLWIKLSASAAWNVHNEIFHFKCENAFMSLAAESADIIMRHWSISERSTFLPLRLRRWLFPTDWTWMDSLHWLLSVSATWVSYHCSCKRMQQENTSISTKGDGTAREVVQDGLISHVDGKKDLTLHYVSFSCRFYQKWLTM